MRATALVLTMFAAAAAIWSWLIGAMVIAPPGGPEELVHDSYYAVTGANYRLPYLLLALVNAAAVVALARGAGKRRALWFVLAGAALLMVAAGAHYWWSEGIGLTRRVPDYAAAEVPWQIWVQYIAAWLVWPLLIISWLVYVEGRLRARRRDD